MILDFLSGVVVGIFSAIGLYYVIKLISGENKV
jgi:hypothetical protein